MSKAHRKDCSKICCFDILSTTWVTAKTEYARGWEIVQLVQHGQASIERGFSLNKQASDVNMEKDTGSEEDN